ncbi:MAG: hypothetical protein ACRELB_11915, partial [Polyangiaceae bacterium]
VLERPGKTTRKQQIEETEKFFASSGGKLIARKELSVSGRDAVTFETELVNGGQLLHYLVLLVIDGERTITVTYTTLPAEFPKLEKEIRASLASFQLTRAAATGARSRGF